MRTSIRSVQPGFSPDIRRRPRKPMRTLRQAMFAELSFQKSRSYANVSKILPISKLIFCTRLKIAALAESRAF